MIGNRFYICTKGGGAGAKVTGFRVLEGTPWSPCALPPGLEGSERMLREAPPVNEENIYSYLEGKNNNFLCIF